MSKRLKKKFEELKSQNKKAFVSYVMAGDPDFDSGGDIINKLANSGVDIIELGMAFSDPMAEGPIIQEAAKRALKCKSNITKVLEQVAEFRQSNNNTPIILMGYYNPIFSYGAEKFVADSLEAGVDGFIIVDLPPEEEEEITSFTQDTDISLIKLTTPTTDDKRIEKILRNAGGFVYYISVAGVTGQKEAQEDSVKKQVDFIKGKTNLPVCVGFGIKNAETAKKISKISDGIVIGSAIVKIIAENVDDRNKILSEIENFCLNIRDAIDG